VAFWEVLSQPASDPEHRQMRAWLKKEMTYGRIRKDEADAYIGWLIEQFGPIENAQDEWLTQEF
jgi:hypothetical protein